MPFRARRERAPLAPRRSTCGTPSKILRANGVRRCGTPFAPSATRSRRPRVRSLRLKEVVMICKGVMQHPVKWIGEDDTAWTAARRMRDENIGFLPVCDQSGRVVGTLTDRDLTIRVLADDLPAGTKVREVMTRDLVACEADDELAKAEQMMSARQKSRIVCTDDGGHLVGIISIADIAKHDEGAQVARTVRQIMEREWR